MMSTTLRVSIIGSITSSGILVSLLFWMLSVSKEFKFSNAIAGKVLMLCETEIISSLMKSYVKDDPTWRSGAQLLIANQSKPSEGVFGCPGKLTRFSADSGTWWSRRSPRRRLPGCNWCCWISSRGDAGGEAISENRSEFDASRYLPGASIEDFLKRN